MSDPLQEAWKLLSSSIEGMLITDPRWKLAVDWLNDNRDARCPNEWRSIDDLPSVPEDPEDEYDERCIVVWQDAECLADIGVDTTCLAHIRDGDYTNDRYLKPVWRTMMDAPPFDYDNPEED